MIHPETSQGQLSTWDRPAALNRLMNKEALLARLVHVYLDENIQRMAEFEIAINSGLVANIMNVVHSINGVAANLSLDRLQYLSNELEQKAKGGDVEIAAELGAKNCG